MRIRSIKPEFWTDALTGEWDARLALFYIGVWQAADDAGRLRLDARLLHASLDPFDSKFGGTEQIAALLETLVELRRILPYDGADGRRYGLIARFQHQRINKPTKSRLPEPPKGLRDPSVSPHRILPEPSVNAQGALRESAGSPRGALPQNHVVDQGSGIRGSGSEGSGSEGSGSEGSGSEGECAEPVAGAPASAPPSPVAFTIPCVGRGPRTYDVTEAQVDEWSLAFPGVDVLAELRRSAAWQDANPTKRKTHKGMAAHLVRWLGRAQDGGRARVNGTVPGPATQPAAPSGAFVGGPRAL